MTELYFSRVTSSARGELFNFLIWPYLLTTLVYGIGFAILLPLTSAVGDSLLYTAMAAVWPLAPLIWGWVAILTILGGLTFLMFNIPPFGKVSGIFGFMLWLFAAICYGFAGSYLVLVAIAVPNMVFWIWQYISLSRFRREDAEDRRHGRA